MRRFFGEDGYLFGRFSSCVRSHDEKGPPECNGSRTRPGWVEPEVYFRIIHGNEEDRHVVPASAYAGGDSNTPTGFTSAPQKGEPE